MPSQPLLFLLAMVLTALSMIFPTDLQGLV